MSFGSLRSLVLGINQAVLGVTAASVTRPAPDNTPITVGADGHPLKVIWAVEPVSDGQPYGSDLHRVEPRKVLAVSRADVPTLPRGTTITAPGIDGEANKTWVVDGLERTLADQWRAFVKLQN